MDDNTGRKPPTPRRSSQTRSDAGEFSRRQAASDRVRRSYSSRRDDHSEVERFDSSRPSRPVAMLDLEADVQKPRARRTRASRSSGTSNKTRPSAPRPTIRFANTGRTSSRVIRSVGYNVRTGLNLSRILSLVGLIALLIVAYWMLNSPNFLISQVKLSGNHFLDSQSVIAQTGVDKINVFLLNENDVANKIKQLPYVLDAKVEKGLPNQLTVKVVERQEAVNWKIGQVNYLTDKDGVVLQVLQTLPDTASQFPVINSLDARELKVGDKVDQVAVQSLQDIQTSLAQNSLEVASIDYSPTNGLTLVSKDGKWKALFGSSAELDKKFSILKGLLADNNVKWSFADLRWTTRPAVQ